MHAMRDIICIKQRLGGRARNAQTMENRWIKIPKGLLRARGCMMQRDGMHLIQMAQKNIQNVWQDIIWKMQNANHVQTEQLRRMKTRAEGKVVKYSVMKKDTIKKKMARKFILCARQDII